MYPLRALISIQVYFLMLKELLLLLKTFNVWLLPIYHPWASNKCSNELKSTLFAAQSSRVMLFRFTQLLVYVAEWYRASIVLLKDVVTLYPWEQTFTARAPLK